MCLVVKVSSSRFAVSLLIKRLSMCPLGRQHIMPLSHGRLYMPSFLGNTATSQLRLRVDITDYVGNKTMCN